MNLVYGFAPFAFLIAAWLLIKLICDWLDSRNFTKQATAKVATFKRATSSGSRSAHQKAGEPAKPPRTAAEHESVSSFGKTTPAHRLARVRASEDREGADGIKAQPIQPVVPPKPPLRVNESVTAVLRRQVPVRSEAPRSWLGGLPKMPEGVEWPRGVNPEYADQGGAPLHFLAQIACEDLPKDLWGGRGPRSGWLLFFINPNHYSAKEEDFRRVMYTAELGVERQPPFDSGPVHDKVSTGGSYNWLQKDDVPAFWRRWPVDVVTMPNELTVHEQEGSIWKTASPDDLSSILYADVPYTKTEFSLPMPRMRPMTFGHANEAVQALSKELRRKVRPPIDDKARELLLAEGGHAHLIDDIKTTIAKISVISHTDRSETQTRWLAYLKAVLPEYAESGAEQVLQSIEHRHGEWIKWREKLALRCDETAAVLSENNPEQLFHEVNWQQLNETFACERFDRIELRHSRFRDVHFPVSLMLTRDVVQLKPPQAMSEIAIEYYLDPAKRDLLPTDYSASQEPAWRTLYNNRPHRMGGYHDGIQSEPIEGDFDQVLLLQIASDDAMDWCWGDGGAFYFWIRPEHLEKSDFSGVEVWLECH